MNTPNPNPSPRDLLAQAYQDNGDLGAAGYIRSGHDLTPDTQIALLAIKDALALSPQTLPAPGEVEDVRKRAQSIWDKRWFCIEGEWSPDEEPIETDEPRRFAEIAITALSPTLATVAAANDEGVASDTVAFVQDWLMNADYDPTQFDKGFAAAIDARVSAAYEAAAKVAADYALEYHGKAERADASMADTLTAHGYAGSNIAAAIRLLSQGGGKA